MTEFEELLTFSLQDFQDFAIAIPLIPGLAIANQG
ncbi:hypothetical protein NIES2135_32670 [Leptolyngbya boryana NIES-2135]|uniref:Uncharacterized protein n=1 Tax=Leptolyngbya boryana NIES-2135 TaxID=1973484 RepID=A0A1Z4JI64_LEPBY|nr:hypothetical protein NIES2135_32670 [Leptolyngbya boryana NIES-2135]